MSYRAKQNKGRLVQEDPHISDRDWLPDKGKNPDALYQDRWTKVVTVMSTNLKTLSGKRKDSAGILLINQYLDIVLSAIEKNNGVCIGPTRTGMLSYFDNAQDALRTAVAIQHGIDEFNLAQSPGALVLARVGLHTGRCIIEKNEISGDVVHTASRLGSMADGGAIFLSEETYNALSEKSEIYCKLIKTMAPDEKQRGSIIYKAYWSMDELQTESVEGNPPAFLAQGVAPTVSVKKILILALIALLLLILLMQGSKIRRVLFQSDEKRSIQEYTDVSPSPETTGSRPR